MMSLTSMIILAALAVMTASSADGNIARSFNLKAEASNEFMSPAAVKVA